MTSSIGIAVHSDNLSRRELRQRGAAVNGQRRELRALVERLEPQITRDPDAAAAHHSALLALSTATSQLVGLHRELSDEYSAPASFGDLVTVLRPSSNDWAVAPRPGRFKGCLTFPHISQVDSLAAELPDSSRLKKEINMLGVDLLFCYACPIPLLPHPAMVDYHHASILKVPPATSLAGALKRVASYAVPGATMQLFKEESAEKERQRWALAAAEILPHRDFDEWLVG